MRSAPSPAPNEAPPNAAPAESTAQRPMAIALAGMVALAVAMGIGRFAFTPLLPMMLHDGLLDLPGASWLASANYFGYLVGAVLCTLQPWLWARLRVLPLFAFVTLVRGGLVATGLLTLAMAWPAPAAWPVLRFAAGVTSAVVFVYTSGWCMARLARLGVPALSGMIYMGPGAGIVLSGLAASAMTAWHWRAAAGWVLFGLLAWVLAASVWRTLRGSDERLHAGAPAGQAAGPTGSGASAPPQGRAEMAWLALAYGLAGFGYIITATFLPVIARTALPGSAWLDMFWPIFGLGVMAGALLVSRLPHGGDFRLRLIVCYVLQAAGVAASLYRPSLAGFVLGSVLLGLPFTAITFFAMHEVRRLRPAQAASFIGLLTAMYGVGQILGPALVALLLRRLPDAATGFALSLEVAAAALFVGALIYAGMVWAYPVRAAKH